MTVEIEVDGRRRAVDVRGSGSEWTVAVEGHPVPVSVSDVGGRWLLLMGTRSYDVAFDVRPGGDLGVLVNGDVIPVRVLDPRQRFRRVSTASPGAGGAHGQPAAIAAPMPGRVVKVLVKKGDSVAARQGVIVIEAMKMENELRTARAGTVTEVRAAEGASVEAGAVLVVVE